MIIGKWTQAFIIALCLLAAVAPAGFAWMVEISWAPIEGAYMTNGFWDVDALKIYHMALWLNAGTSLMMAGLLLHFLIEVRREGE